MADLLLDYLDLAAPYLPRAVSSPLYAVVTHLPSSLQDVTSNPVSTLVPLVVTLFSTYLALTQFVRTAQWAIRTALTLVKVGLIASVVGAVWMGYENVGTDKGVVGGVTDAYRVAETVGRGVFDLGRRGAGWYLGQMGSRNGASTTTSGRSGRRQRTTRSTNANNDRARGGGGGWFDRDPDEVDLGKAGFGGSASRNPRSTFGGGSTNRETEEFVRNALEKARGVWGVFTNDDSSSRTRPVGDDRRNARRGGKNDGSGGSAGGFVWNLLAGQAKKVWDEAVEGNDKTTRTSRKSNR
ncbi:hypothetical protein JCM10212_006116 [Sporobolomyces blumeae]